MTTAPRVTVLMAVHNGGAFIDAAVRSILQQRFGDFEFLIIDDGSTDDTVDRIGAFKDPRIRLAHRDVNVGLTRSLNEGLRLARGELIARQDADDVSNAERLALQVDFLNREPHAVALGAQARMIDGEGRPVRTAAWPKSTTDRAIRWQLIFDSPFIHSSVMFRRAAVDALGGYDESFPTSQDFELWSRLARAGEMHNLPETLLDFRLHGGSVSARYRLDAISKLHGVLLNNLVAELGTDAVPDGWPDMWIRMNNPRVFAGAGDPPAIVASAIESIHRHYVERHPESADDPEIRRHLASMLIRLATSAAERGFLASLQPFTRAAQLDARMAAAAAPGYMGRLALGQLKWWDGL